MQEWTGRPCKYVFTDTAIFFYLQLYLWYRYCMKFNFSSFFQKLFNRENNAETVLIVVRKSILLWESENLCVRDKCQRPISHPKSDDKSCQSKHHLTATTISNCHLKLPVIWETFGTEFQDKIYPLFIIYFQYQDCSSFREIRYHIVHLSHIHTRFSLNVNQQQ